MHLSIKLTALVLSAIILASCAVGAAGARILSGDSSIYNGQMLPY